MNDRMGDKNDQLDELKIKIDGFYGIYLRQEDLSIHWK